MTNNWYVITGAPSSGKTTTLQALEKKGFKVIYEASRALIDEEMKKGKTLQEIRKNELEFQKKVLELKVKIEKNLNLKDLVFLERGIPDSIVYYQLCGLVEEPNLEKAVKKSSYKKVFLLELLDYVKDYARTEDEDKAKEIEKKLLESYKKIGIKVIKVPKKTIDERVNFILENL